MNLDTFFEKFELFADAPNAVAKMRELVLGLAVSGRIVRQDPTEGSGADLVSIARAMREKLIREKKLKRPRALQPVAEFERPELPDNWEWSTLNDLTEIGPRNAADDSTIATFLPMASIPQRYGGALNGEPRPWSELKKGFTHLAEGDIVLAKITPCFQNGKSAVITNLENGLGAGTTELHVARPFAPVLDPHYVWIFLKSPQFLLEGVPHMTGSAGQKRIPTGYFALKPFPLPPRAEQKRIVAKVDELMALCDRLEEQQNERETRRAALARASLARFAEAPTPENLELLFYPSSPSVPQPSKGSVPSSLHPSSFNLHPSKSPPSFLIPPSDLRKTILTLAVQGKLVPVDAGREEQTVGDHVEFQNGYAFKSEWFKPDGVRLCRNANVSHGVLDWRESAFVDEEVAIEFKRFALSEGDIVLSLDRPLITTGLKVARVRKSDLPCLLLQRVAKPVARHDALDMSYFLLWLNSPEFVDSIDPGRSNGVPHISTRQVQRLPFALPPLAEQRRIVAKVDQLMALVDDLETQINASHIAAEKLIEAVVTELTTQCAGPNVESSSDQSATLLVAEPATPFSR